MFVVVNAESEFQRPARYGDLLQVTCEVERWSRASLVFRQEVLRGPQGTERELLVTGRVRVACLDATRFRPRPLPESIVSQLNAASANAGDR